MNWIQRLLGYNHPSVEELIENQKAQAEPEVPKNIGEVLFQLTPTGDINIKVIWKDEEFTDGRALVFGEFLHHICSGTFIETMRQIIVQIALENVEHKEFVIKAINKWQSLIEDSDDCNNVPAISPLAVFNLTPTKDESE